MHRLIYVSMARPGALENSLLNDILAVAAPRNEELNITGALLFCGGWFVQALEGSLRNVSDIYGRIYIDPRHQVIRLVTSGPILARSFGQWSMCGSELSPTDASIVRILENNGNFDARRLNEHSALSLLSLVADLQMPRNRLTAV